MQFDILTSDNAQLRKKWTNHFRTCVQSASSV